MGRLILVSNRLPVQIRKEHGKHVIAKSSGGLVAGLGPVHEEGGLWVGTLGTGKAAISPRELEKQRLAVVPLKADDAKRHYEGYSNGVLWPLCHYLLEHVAFDSRDFDAYRRVNEVFADHIAAVAEKGDRIWVHDYHLMLLPGMLRQRLPHNPIAFFLHIPFPSSEVFRTLPRKEEILQGLLGANLIGLHTYDYARHLVSSFRRVLGVEFSDDWVRTADGSCKVGVFPLGVDVSRFASRAQSPEVQKKLARWRKHTEGRRVILGVDRMDYTKGLPLRLEAFRALLSRRDWRKKVMLMQLAVPSRSSIASYKALKEDVDRLVGDINGKFEQDGMTPVHYMYRSVPEDELVALYCLADVALVTPIRDGMNLVAKEYVASRIHDDGVLVLSEFAGAASEMGEALLHNPYDVDGTATTIEQALALDKDDMEHRMRGLRRRVQANDVHRWVERFLSEFAAISSKGIRPRLNGHADAEAEPQDAWVPQLVRQFVDADRALLALDYDGTLTELVDRPERAEPSADLLNLLHALGTLPHVRLVLISGRDSRTLEKWLGSIPASLVAEHGLHWRLAGTEHWKDLIPSVDVSWKQAVREILEDYASRSPGAMIEEKRAAVVWHYRQVEPAFGEWQARELMQHLSEAFANAPLEVLHGSKIVEIRPQGFDKGRAYLALRKKLGPFDVELAAGDDRTDEDLFRAMSKDSWSVKIGAGASAAAHRLPNPESLRNLLTMLVRQAGDLPRQYSEGV